MPWNTPLTEAGRPDAGLRELAADHERGEHDAAEHRAERMEPAHERDDDRGEPVTARDVRRELAHRAGDLEGAGDPRARPRRGASSRPPRATRTAYRAAAGAGPPIWSWMPR